MFSDKAAEGFVSDTSLSWDDSMLSLHSPRIGGFC